MIITIEQAEKAASKFTKLPSFNSNVMKAQVGCEDRNFCIKVYLSQRLDLDELPREIDGVKVYFEYATWRTALHH
jgi:hypothetical protein